MRSRLPSSFTIRSRLLLYFVCLVVSTAAAISGITAVIAIGIGTGGTIPYYPEAVKVLTALEPTDGVRRRALRRAEARGMRIEWHRGRGERLPFEDERFDSVVLVDVLCSAEDVDAVLAEAY